MLLLPWLSIGSIEFELVASVVHLEGMSLNWTSVIYMSQLTGLDCAFRLLTVSIDFALDKKTSKRVV